MGILLSVVALALAACSSQTEESQPVAILDGGDVIVLDSDGSNRVVITEEQNDSYFQPTWSPDGDLLAFSSNDPDPTLHVGLTDGSDLHATTTGSFPFYFSWSSDNDLAFLSNGASGLALEITSLTDGTLASPRLIDSGQPLYYSWNPEGTMLATHIGTDRLELNDLGSTQPLGPRPGMFQSPQWTEGGIAAIEQGLRDQTLSIIGLDGEATAVATVLGPATFVATNDGTNIAIQSVQADSGAVNASFQVLPTIPSNRLVVIDTETGEHTTVTQDPVLAYFWDPAGDRLLVFDIVPGPQARWSIWSEDGLQEMVRFDPEPGFVGAFIPFFDQYAQSVSLWAPDGSAFAFPGGIDGESGIWVQSIDGDLDRISDGTWVAWSP